MTSSEAKQYRLDTYAPACLQDLYFVRVGGIDILGGNATETSPRAWLDAYEVLRGTLKREVTLTIYNWSQGRPATENELAALRNVANYCDSYCWEYEEE